MMWSWSVLWVLHTSFVSSCCCCCRCYLRYGRCRQPVMQQARPWLSYFNLPWHCLFLFHFHYFGRGTNCSMQMADNQQPVCLLSLRDC
ncbi:hypothetical protein F5H01DRAFT_328721 [Linnemannia elongata]|nr:hypothetical protein F5H01DRAFT_328721 [Linnemannia elongata]